jgi:hypothetical protein
MCSKETDPRCRFSSGWFSVPPCAVPPSALGRIDEPMIIRGIDNYTHDNVAASKNEQ